MRALLALILTTSATLASADELFRWGCGGEPWSHIKWEVYVPEGTTNPWNRSVWRVTKEPNHPDCVWVDDVVIEGEADRFTEATVEVVTNATEWDYEIDRGTGRREGHLLFVRGDGDADYSILTLTIAGRTEEHLIPFREEPRCEVFGGVDCVGYLQQGGYSLIYYGDEHPNVVDVEVLITHYDRDADEPVRVHEGYAYEQSLKRVAKWNAIVAKDDIRIRFVLKEVWRWDNTDLRAGERFTRSRPVDIGLGRGTTYPNTCGVAYPNTRFTQAGFGFSNCFETTDLHELGHVVGLAHGPNNSSYPHEGYIFPEFGHGDYNQCNARTDDIMSYGSKDHFFNSSLSCAERFGSRYDSTPAGDRFRADSAYHWNRIRYDLSLIHDEHAKESPASARLRIVEEDNRPLVID